MMLYTESIVDQTNHFADAFACENVAYGYDIVTAFSRRHSVKKSSVRTGIFECFARIRPHMLVSLHYHLPGSLGDV